MSNEYEGFLFSQTQATKKEEETREKRDKH